MSERARAGAITGAMGCLSAGLVVAVLAGVSVVGGGPLRPSLEGPGYGTIRLALPASHAATAPTDLLSLVSRRASAAAELHHRAEGGTGRTRGRALSAAHAQVSARVNVHAGPVHRTVEVQTGSSSGATIGISVHTPVADASVKVTPPVK